LIEFIQFLWSISFNPTNPTNSINPRNPITPITAMVGMDLHRNLKPLSWYTGFGFSGRGEVITKE